VSGDDGKKQDFTKIIRDHDNIIKNLRQEVNMLTQKSEQSEKV
jgi:hypothetical protein